LISGSLTDPGVGSDQNGLAGGYVSHWLETLVSRLVLLLRIACRVWQCTPFNAT
jgi:hypothetical protein